ncbi:MAG TPA: hypothetical protein VKU60_19875 [Chloroflexota bacterium]|nr:hypothetical protein [Chloroflexota bacterium]
MSKHDLILLGIAAGSCAVIVGLYAAYLQQSHAEGAAFREKLLDELRAAHAVPAKSVE